MTNLIETAAASAAVSTAIVPTVAPQTPVETTIVTAVVAAASWLVNVALRWILKKLRGSKQEVEV